MAMQNTPYRIAVSGTLESPNALAQKFLKGATGEVIYSVEFAEAAEAGYIMLPKVYWFKNVPTIPTFEEEKDYQKVYIEGILENDARNEITVRAADYFVKKGKSVLIVVDRVEQHSETLRKQIEYLQEFKALSDQFKAQLLTVTDPPEKRKEVFEKLKRKEITVLITTLAKEGVDIPSLDVVIMASGGKSRVAVLQKAGRVVRTDEGKEQPIVVDFEDGIEGESNCSYLINHSKHRLRLYKKERFEIEIVEKDNWENLLKGDNLK